MSAGGEGGGMRLQKFLSRAGVASRRQAEGLMAQGRVTVNGVPAVTPGIRVDPRRDTVEVDGRRVGMESPRWILLNKPRGVLTTRKDPGGRPTVYGLLPPDARSLRYVGRLDRDTEGLLLLTNQGDVAHRLLHPSTGVTREYRVLVEGLPGPEAFRRLADGVELEDGPARAESVRLLSRRPDGSAVVSLVLREGRKREVRRLLEAVGHPVRRLRREAFGPLRLVDLRPGAWRDLEAREIRALEEASRGRAPLR
jgi:23S rRNA pseudouridine2605 synthase